MNKTLKHPDVHFPPPVLYAAFIGCGWLLQKLLPLPALTLPVQGMLGLGLGLVLAGLLIVVWASVEFKHHKTTILPHKASSAIISSGPFRFSRNPIYVSFSIIQLGAALLLANLWVLVLLLPVMLIMGKYVIEREEAFLTQEFGEPYIEYKKRVRRWL